MTTKSSKTKFNFWGNENPEKLKEAPIASTVGKQLTDIVNPVKLLDQIFSSKSSESNNYPNKRETTPAFRKQEFTVFSFKDRQIKEETAQILDALKKQVSQLEKSEKALTKEISKVKVEQLPPKTGIYYLRYFEWLMGVIRAMRMKIEEGRAWLATFNQRKSKKIGYWKMYKKHGTTFGMSQERSLATQTG